MKRIFTIAAALLMTANVWAQAPEKMSYQAVVRNSSNALVTSTAVGMQISVLQGSTSGTVVYTETQSPITNANGLVSLEIGTGTTTDNFSTIDWANGPYFIKTETDPTGGTTYTITGTSQLMSVPFALFANVADSVVGGVGMPLDSTGIANLGFSATDNVDDADADASNELQSLTVSTTGDTLTINGGNSVLVPGISVLNFPPLVAVVGDFRDGGIVFWVDPTDNTKGLVVDMADLSTSAWGCSGVTITGADGTAIGTGVQNTIDIEAECTTTGTAADLCANNTSGGYSDWFLPSTGELVEIYTNLTAINNAITNNSGTAIISSSAGIYWSSSERNSVTAYNYNFNTGNSIDQLKSSTIAVRAVRAF